MKIMHLCLANFYIDNYSYQENILPKEHAKLGHEVYIVASTETFINNNKLGYLKPSEYINEYGIRVARLPYKKFAPHFIMKKLRSYIGLYEKLVSYKPDVIFVHDVQFLDAFVVKRYVEENENVKVYVDCHADFSNSARNFISREFFHKIIYKLCAQALNTVAVKFWGVLPSRVNFLKEVYGLPVSKIDLLLMGAEDNYIALKQNSFLIEDIKRKLGVNRKKLTLVTGGKIDKYKTETLAVIEAVKDFQDDVDLIIFGSISNDIELKFTKLVKDSTNIKYLGWLSIEETFQTLAIADLAIFPGRHSVLWEQCVAIGVPLVVKSWDALYHLDIGGNLIWLEKCDAIEMSNIIRKCLDEDFLNKMKNNAKKSKRLEFSYSKIARRSIQN